MGGRLGLASIARHLLGVVALLARHDNGSAMLGCRSGDNGSAQTARGVHDYLRDMCRVAALVVVVVIPGSPWLQCSIFRNVDLDVNGRIGRPAVWTTQGWFDMEPRGHDMASNGVKLTGAVLQVIQGAPVCVHVFVWFGSVLLLAAPHSPT